MSRWFIYAMGFGDISFQSSWYGPLDALSWFFMAYEWWWSNTMNHLDQWEHRQDKSQCIFTLFQANQYPWVVLLRIKAATCGGTLIASKYILTAAHCVFNRSGTILREGAPVKLTDIKVWIQPISRLCFDLLDLDHNIQSFVTPASPWIYL